MPRPAKCEKQDHQRSGRPGQQRTAAVSLGILGQFANLVRARLEGAVPDAVGIVGLGAKAAVNLIANEPTTAELFGKAFHVIEALTLVHVSKNRGSQKEDVGNLRHIR